MAARGRLAGRQDTDKTSPGGRRDVSKAVSHIYQEQEESQNSETGIYLNIMLKGFTLGGGG